LQAIASTHETLQMDALIKLFLTEDHSGNIREPICQDFVPGDKKNDEVSHANTELVNYFYMSKEIEKLPNVVESELSNLKDEGDFEKLASYLTDRFEEVKTHGFALYYSSFYWRLKGNSANALKCLHRYIDYSPESE
jgi:hypothetical protein